MPKDDEVLVRVRAASMHPDVWHVIVGYPFVLRLMGNGVRKPKRRIPGTDLSGVVESVGRNVTRFKAGDEVFGESAGFGWLNGGAYAEFVAVSQDWLALKPKNVTFEQAAAVPTAGTIALGNLGGARRPARRNVLINGAGGCMGPIAVQIAKADGAHVTAVDCAEKLPMLRSLGADQVIDYRKEDYLRNGERYDFILDVVSIRSPQGIPTRAVAHGNLHPHRPCALRQQRDAASWETCRIFVGLLLRMLLDPEKRKELQDAQEAGSDGDLQRAARIRKAHPDRRQDIFSERSPRRPAMDAGRPHAGTSHHHAVTVASMPYTYEYPRGALTVDCVVFGLDEEDLKVLLIQRALPPFEGTWALPGGFVRVDETLEDAARRELEEETGLRKVFLEQLYTFGARRS